MPNKTLYQKCIELNIEVENHYSDLYIPVTEETKKLVKESGLKAQTFMNNINNKLYYDIFGAFDPYWEKRNL